MFGPRLALALGLALALTNSRPAHASGNDWFAAGLGAQYAFVSDAPQAREGAPRLQYGFVSRLKFLKIFGIEGTWALDEAPRTQDSRILSPRYQLGAMLNLVPTEHFNVFAVAGLGAHDPSDLFDLGGRSTSFHGGPGLEVFVTDNVAIGGDVRFRMPGPMYVEEAANAARSLEPVDDLVNLKVWQVNLMVGLYL